MQKLILTTSLLLLTIPATAQAGNFENDMRFEAPLMQEVQYSEESRKGIATSSQIMKRLTAHKTDSAFYVSPNIDLSIKFKPGSATLSQQAQVQLVELAEALNHPDLLYREFVIEGHTDSNGDAASNKALSKRRAMAVVNVLKNKYDVNTDKITATGYGESKPVADNATSEGRAKNRRVTIVRVK